MTGGGGEARVAAKRRHAAAPRSGRSCDREGMPGSPRQQARRWSTRRRASSGSQGPSAARHRCLTLRSCRLRAPPGPLRPWPRKSGCPCLWAALWRALAVLRPTSGDQTCGGMRRSRDQHPGDQATSGGSIQLTIGRSRNSGALARTMASNPNTAGALTAAQRLQAGGLPHSGSKGVLYTDNGQEHVQALDFRLSSCAARAGSLAALPPCQAPSPALPTPPQTTARTGSRTRRSSTAPRCGRSWSRGERRRRRGGGGEQRLSPPRAVPQRWGSIWLQTARPTCLHAAASPAGCAAAPLAPRPVVPPLSANLRSPTERHAKLSTMLTAGPRLSWQTITTAAALVRASPAAVALGSVHPVNLPARWRRCSTVPLRSPLVFCTPPPQGGTQCRPPPRLLHSASHVQCRMRTVCACSRSNLRTPSQRAAAARCALQVVRRARHGCATSSTRSLSAAAPCVPPRPARVSHAA